MRSQIEQLVETLTMNIGYPVSLDNLGILHDHTFYFDICLIIFPQFHIKIIKINEESSLTPSQKFQKLLELLTEELQINLAALSAAQILSGHSHHLYNFLNVLKQFSYLPPHPPPMISVQYRQRTNSCPSLHEIQKNTKQPQSARQEPRERRLSGLVKKESQEQIEESQNHVNEEKENEIVQPEPVVGRIKQKSILELKNVRKVSKKNQTTKKIIKSPSAFNVYKSNKKYTNLLQKLMKGKQEKGKKGKHKNYRSSQAVTQVRADWKKEIKDIDDFFKSFELKIRDQKQKYLRKMQQLIREQQNQRIRVKQRQNIQRSKKVEQKNSMAIQNLMNSHNIRKSVLKQRQLLNKQTIRQIKKQEMRVLQQQRKGMKIRRRKQIKQIKNYINEQNNKILMKLEEGGQLQKMIINLYKQY